MNARWMVAAKKADFASLGAELNIDPVIVRIMRNRDMTTADEMRAFLSKDARLLHAPSLLPDMDKAVRIIRDKITAGKTIRIIGDYDVDGVTATCILYKGLRELGANVSYAIPNRVYDGYGINESMIDKAYEDGIDTVVTCDNGIAASSAIDKAKSYGMTCIVTDHHEVPYKEEDGERTYIYPHADAVIDPKIPDCGYPYPGICGAMVAYKLISALDEGLACLPELKELAGLGTVCDVMELMDENRAVVTYALSNMGNSANTGIRALRRVCGIEDKPVNVHELGFIIGPCINATGRLDSAETSVELLLSDDISKAALNATELKNLNDLRKSYTEEGLKQAVEIIEAEAMAEDKVIVLYLPKLHESLAGIVAGRIKEKYYRPTLVFTDSEDMVKASGRSIEAYNMYDELNKCADLYSKFGGHAMAAGLSMPKENLSIFKDRIEANCSLTEEELTRKILIDVPMPLSYVTEELINQLSLLEPFGTGNPSPIFADKSLEIVSVREMGKTGDMCRMRVKDASGRMYDLVMFSGYEDLRNEVIKAKGVFEPTGINIDIIYYPDINEYNGRRSIQYLVKDFNLHC